MSSSAIPVSFCDFGLVAMALALVVGTMVQCGDRSYMGGSRGGVSGVATPPKWSESQYKIQYY